MCWAFWQTLNIINDSCFSWLLSPQPSFPFCPLAYSEFPVFSWVTAAGWLLQGHTVRNTESSLLATMVLQKGAVAAAEKHAGYCSRAFLWSPEAGCWQREPGTAQDPRFLENMALLNPGALATLPEAVRKHALRKLRTKSRQTGGESHGIEKPMAARKQP